MSAAFTPALQAFREGRFPEAARLLDDDPPDDVDGWSLRALVAARLGDDAGAIAASERALQLDPDHVPSLVNRAAPLRRLRRFAEADATLAAALARRPGLPAALLGRAWVAADDERWSEALSRADQALAAQPASGEAAEVRGRALLALARPSEAIAAVQSSLPRAGALWVTARALLVEGRLGEAHRVLAAWPPGEDADLAIWQVRGEVARHLRDRGQARLALDLVAGGPAAVWNLEGTLRRQLGELERATQLFRAATATAPDDGAAWHNLGVALLESGEHEAAVDAHLRALSLDPQGVGLGSFAEAVGRASRFPDAARPWVAAALRAPDLAHQPLERAVRAWMEHGAGVGAALSGAMTPETAAELDDPLLVDALQTTRIQGPAWERLLTEVRRRAMIGEIPLAPRLAAALAVQAWHTGYAWWADVDEIAMAEAHPNACVRAWYRPPGRAEPGLPAEVLRVAVEEPARQQALAAEIPALGALADPVSRSVQAQYEDLPYPRLISVTRRPPLPLPALVRQILPHVEVGDPAGPLEVLFAGCGTGSQVLASRYANARLTAIDLSRASLGIAADAARRAGLDVAFFQADLLSLPAAAPEWRRRFHVIECGGVLHHLDDPVAGWRALVALSRPGGLHRIAVYSEIARVGVVKAREKVDDLAVDPRGLREARRRLLEDPDPDVVRSVLWSPDFTSLAGFRDLVRHEHERRFTCARLAAAMQDLGLEFLGFQHADPEARRIYQARYPDDPRGADLARWEEIESEHPHLFVGMYQLWARCP